MSPITLIGFLGLASIAACWALAVVLFRVGAAGTVARKLAYLLVIEGFVLATAEFPEFAMQLPADFYDSRDTLIFVLGLIHHAGDGLMIALYPPFLAVALNTKLTRPFAGKPMQIGLALAAAAMVIAVTLAPSPATYALIYGTMMLVFIYAFVVSIHAWLKASRGPARKRAGIFAIAFGVRDLGWSLSYAISAWLMWTNTYPVEPNVEVMVMKVVYALGTLLAVPLIAYGILRSHLFDIDLKIRWTIKQSTLATVIVTLVFLLSEGADRLLSEELGNWAGLLAAAVVVFFLAPLQRFAESVASAAMPKTKNTAEYATFRKMQVYEEAVAEAQLEDGISDKERALLIRLRDSLGISESDAETIEQELIASKASPL
jgi:hypothetical protein